MVLLSYGFGFMSRNTAEKLASTSSERAVIAAVLAPVCAETCVITSKIWSRHSRKSWSPCKLRLSPTARAVGFLRAVVRELLQLLLLPLPS
jgi:hypothetical protein